MAFHPLFASARVLTLMRAAWLALLCGLLLSAGLPPATAAAPTDVLDINARIHVDFPTDAKITGDYNVDNDGNITMLYVNPPTHHIHVGGLTLTQAQAAIAQALAKLYPAPVEVVVTLVSRGGIVVNVSGPVASPGDRAARAGAHLNDVLQQVGYTLEGNLAAIVITHANGQSVTVDYDSYLQNQNPAGNPVLTNGDQILIPRRSVPIIVNVRGEVGKPGRLSVPAGTTTYDAVQQAGGLTVQADRKRITLQHANSTEQIPFDIDLASQNPNDARLNPVLLDGDTIVVPRTSTYSTYTITGAVRNPADYPLTTSTLSLADAIGKAGGLTDRPKLKETRITRRGQGDAVQVLRLNAEDPLVQGKTLIQAGDNIYIPQGSAPQRIDPFAIIGVLFAVIGILRR